MEKTIEDYIKSVHIDPKYAGISKGVSNFLDVGIRMGARWQKAIDEETHAKVLKEAAAKDAIYGKMLEDLKQKMIDKIRSILNSTLPDTEYITPLSVYRQTKRQYIESVIKAIKE